MNELAQREKKRKPKYRADLLASVQPVQERVHHALRCRTPVLQTDIHALSLTLDALAQLETDWECSKESIVAWVAFRQTVHIAVTRAEEAHQEYEQMFDQRIRFGSAPISIGG